MSKSGDAILGLLNDDLVSHGWVVQCIRDSTEGSGADDDIATVLRELLSTGRVEIGNTELATPDNVSFIAWKGTVEERVQRGLEAIRATEGPDTEFSYWLCLRDNIDDCEADKPLDSMGGS